MGEKEDICKSDPREGGKEGRREEERDVGVEGDRENGGPA